MSAGADFTSRNLTGAEMKAAGLSFACRYLSAHPGGWKELSLAEAKEKTAAGILIVSNWEDTGHPANTVAAGESDAKRALAEATKCGMPAHRPIYFSIDWNTPVDGYDNYFKGICNVLGVDRSGVYGSAGLIAHLHGKGLIKWGWRTMSWAWHGGASTAYSQIEQTGGSSVHGTSIDRDLGLVADIGGWLVGHNYGPPVPNVPPGYTHNLVLVNPQHYDVQALRWQQQMKLHHSSKIAVDGFYGPYSVAVCKAYQKYVGLPPTGVVDAATGAASFK